MIDGRFARAALLLLGVGAAGSCRKAPLSEVGAGFALADATWFEAEQTLFVFWDVSAEQGINEQSAIEIRYRTDTEEVDWTPLSEFREVHTHLPVDCGVTGRCGSTSFHLPDEPRQLKLRLRYHPDGDLALAADTVFNVVGDGPAHQSRSYIVYGVFDEENEHIQWRGRHQFPTLRNEDVEALGLRRTMLIEAPTYGFEDPGDDDNPYRYGVACPTDYTALGFDDVKTLDRAVFSPDALPLEASDAPYVCARATVVDGDALLGTGLFVTGAVARKNPEVRPAFPVLRSPVKDALVVPFYLGPCARTISEEHEAMQRQRLQMEGLPTTCIDDWDTEGFVERMVVMFRDAVDEARVDGRDMVLVVGINQDEVGVSDAIQEALTYVVPAERERSSPRLAGAFVFDSDIRGLKLDELDPVTLWCPTTVDPAASDASARSCAVSPDDLSIDLGPLSFGLLPILPPREQYLDFIDAYSERQAGSITDLTYRAPEFATTSAHVPLDDYGVVTFLDQETITAEPDDAFSYCVTENPALVAFRSELMVRLANACKQRKGADSCEPGLLTLDVLPAWHNAAQEPVYELGLFWEFPFLLRLEYEVVTAVSITAVGFTVPFGFASPAESYYGTETWTVEEIELHDELTQCDRFCDHPTFDSAGVYHVTDTFRRAYGDACYRPDYPALGDSGFPLDP